MSSSLKSIDITYEPINDNNTFTNGDCVTGHVILEVVKDCKIDSLWIKFKGKAEVMWAERHGQTTVVYHSKEKYFSIKHNFIQERNSNGQDEETLLTNENGMLYSNNVTPGRHVYPFTFHFPAKQMPSSFHGSCGKILYTLSTKLSRSLRVPLKASSKINFVTTVDPSSLHDELMTPQHESKFKKMNIFSTGTVSMDVNIEKTGYHQGEGVVVVASIQNNSSREIKPKYCIYRKHSFFARGKRRVNTKDVLKETGDPIPPSANQTVTKIINIPPDTEPAILNCGIIQAEYRLRVYLDVKYASDPKIKFPIVILAASQMPAVEKQDGGASVGAFGMQAAGSTEPQWQMTPQPTQAPPPYQAYQMYPPLPNFGQR